MAELVSPPASDLVERLVGEGLLGMSAAARRLGEYRAGRPCHPSTVTRWATDGVVLADGRRVRLESLKLNGRLVTSWPALLRFISVQQPAGVDPVPAPRSPTRRRRGSDAAATQLDRIGI